MQNAFFLFFILLPINAKTQISTIEDSLNILYSLKNDSLFIGTDSVITIGQKLIVGEGSDENGWYQSMQFKSAFAWPIWLFRNSELNNKYYQQDASYIRGRDKVKNYLSPQETLEITKIKKEGNKRRGYTYIVYLRNKSFPGLNFYCNIKLALETKEILMP